MFKIELENRNFRKSLYFYIVDAMEKWLFSIIYFEKTIEPIFIKHSGFVYHVKDYFCVNFRNQQSFLTCLK